MRNLGTGQDVGVIGLGQIGLAVARNLLSSGFTVHGYRRSSMEALVEAGGTPARSPAEVAARCDVVFTCLPSAAALEEVVDGDEGLATVGKAGLVVLEMSTLPLKVKTEQAARLASAGATMLDCPLSGTRAMVVAHKAVIFVSGDETASRSVRGVLDGLTNRHFYLGEFGTGSKMKYVANMLVAVHTMAAAEAMVLGAKSGMDPELILKVIGASAASSRMFEMRAPMMVSRRYRPSAGRLTDFLKVLDMISVFGADFDCPTPLFDTTKKHFEALANHQPHDDDISAIHAVLSEAAGG